MHDQFVTTTRGLRREAPIMRLYEKAKRLGIWNPSDIDFSQDARDWEGLDDQERDLILRLTASFVAGEEAVTLDILPLIITVAREGRVEEELYLTTFLFEEGKHTDFFRRFLDALPGDPGDLARFHSENYRTLFYELLPAAMHALVTDPSPANQVRAATTYNMVVEGVLAETGYHAYLAALERNGLMPGQCKGIRLLKQDESRHIAYGVYYISRLLAAHGELWPVFDETMNTLLPYALGVVGDMFAAYDVVPFGLVEDDFIGFALDQFNRRYTRIERARDATPEELERSAEAIVEE